MFGGQLSFLARAGALAALASAAACSPQASATYPERRGDRGDPCVLVNDCKKPLLCLGGRCLDQDSSPAPTGKQCVAVECIEDDDCCPPASPHELSFCADQEASCAAGDDWACHSYETDCVCHTSCEGYRCAPVIDSSRCQADFECPLGLCRDGRCAACTEDAECGEGLICEAGSCLIGCSRDEQCGLLRRCDASRCQPRACIDDRECVLALRRIDAVCRDDACVIPCKSDAACAWFSALATCHEGICADVGCERNSDCNGSIPEWPAALFVCLPREQATQMRRGDFVSLR